MDDDYKPLDSNSLSKLMIFAVLLLPTLFVFIGIIPAFFLAFGIFMTKKNMDFSNITTAVRNYKGYCLILIAGAVLCAAYYATTLNAIDSWDRKGDEFVGFTIATLVFIMYFFFCDALFLKPLQAHKSWIEQNGFFSNKALNSSHKSEKESIAITRGGMLNTFSVADELTKWVNLKESGHITEEEFNAARKRLLSKE